MTGVPRRQLREPGERAQTFCASRPLAVPAEVERDPLAPPRCPRTLTHDVGAVHEHAFRLRDGDDEPEALLALSRFSVPVALCCSLSYWCVAVDVGWERSGPVARPQLLVGISAVGGFPEFPIGPATLVVAPADEPLPLSDARGVLGTERDVRQDDRDRVQRIAWIQPTGQRPARRLDHLRRRSSAQGTGGPGCRRHH